MADPGGGNGTTERRGGGLRAVAGPVRSLARPLVRQHGFAGSDLMLDWPAVVGEELAAHTWPERIARRGRDGATLHLRVEGPWALELQHMHTQLLERINGYFGFAAVARLKIRQGPMPGPAAAPPPQPPVLPERRERRLREAVAPVRDETLRDALQRLGRRVADPDGSPK